MLPTIQVGTLTICIYTSIVYTLHYNVEENGVMSLVRQRLPQMEYMSYATENEMVQSVRSWRESSQNNTRIDTCVNGYGQNLSSLILLKVHFVCHYVNRCGV